MKPNDQKTDAELFAEAVKYVKRLRSQNLAESTNVRTKLRSTPRVDTSEAGDVDGMAFVRSGVQKAIIRKLRNGQIRIEDELDLHGHTVSEAEPVLRGFLLRAQAPGRQVAVRVIHGKGLGSPGTKPVLKRTVRDWLVRNSLVLACCEAGPGDGGSGAVHVLLRRK
jgi:DNA-nicking Smr family endonuclease